MQVPQSVAAGNKDTALNIQLDRMERVKGETLTIRDTVQAMLSQYAVTVDMGVYQLDKHNDRAERLLRLVDSAIIVKNAQHAASK